MTSELASSLTIIGPLATLAAVVLVIWTAASGTTRVKHKRITRREHPIRFTIELMKLMILAALLGGLTFAAYVVRQGG